MVIISWVIYTREIREQNRISTCGRFFEKKFKLDHSDYEL